VSGPTILSAIRDSGARGRYHRPSATAASLPLREGGKDHTNVSGENGEKSVNTTGELLA